MDETSRNGIDAEQNRGSICKKLSLEEKNGKEIITNLSRTVNLFLLAFK